MAKKSVTRAYIVEGVSRALIDFGYPDASPEIIGEIYDAFKAGKRFPDIPHGVLGAFAEEQFKDIKSALGDLP